MGAMRAARRSRACVEGGSWAFSRRVAARRSWISRFCACGSPWGRMVERIWRGGRTLLCFGGCGCGRGSGGGY